jgi:Ca2+-binding RTX toxin-like protein
MAVVTAADRSKFIALHLTMFGKAPTSTQLDFMERAWGFGSSLAEIATGFSKEAGFAQVTALSADAFAEYVVDTLLAASIPAAARDWSINWVLTQLQGAKTKAQVVAEAVNAVYVTANPEFASSQTELQAEAAAAMSSQLAAEAAVVDATAPPDDPMNFALTASADDFTGGTADDTVTGSLSDLGASDVLSMGSGDDVIEVLGDGVAGAADVSSANFDVTLSSSSTIDAASFSDVDSIDILPASTSATTLTVNNASYATTYGIDAAGKTIGLTVNFANSAGGADTAKLDLAGVGSSTVNVSGSATEAVIIATSGSNTMTLNGGTALANITITGSGTNIFTISSSATDLTVDASASTGSLQLTLPTLSGNNTLLGGSGDDTFNGGRGNDSIDVGTGADTIRLTAGTFFGATGTNNPTTVYADSVTGWDQASDFLTISIGNLASTSTASVTLSNANGADIATVANGVATVASVAAGDVVDAATVSAHIIKLTSTTASSFGTAIGSGSVTIANFANNLNFAGDAGSAEGVLVMWYDSSNSRAVLSVYVAANADNALDAADGGSVHDVLYLNDIDLIGYSSLDTSHISFSG